MATPTAQLPSPALDRASRSLLPAMLLGTAPTTAPGGRRSARDWTVDALTFLFAVGIGVVGYVGEHGSPLGDPVALADAVAGALCCGVLWLRRRHPVQLALLATAGATVFTSTGGASIVLLFSLAVHRDIRWVAGVGLLQVPSVLIFAALYPDPELPYGWLVLFVCAIVAMVLAWGTVVRARRQLVLSLQERAARAEGEQQLRVEGARQQERARIAREMHDVLAHRISLVSLHAGALEFRPDTSPDEVARAAGVIRASAHEALEDLRQVIGVLRDGDSSGGAAEASGSVAEVRPQPGVADLPALIAESREAGTRIDVALDADPSGLPAAAGRTAYRVVQEGLTNARKHAWGATVRVDVSGTAGAGLTVEVRTPAVVGGPRLGPEIPGAGTGLVGLRERLDLADGRLDAGRTDDGGFLLHAWIPWPA